MAAVPLIVPTLSPSGALHFAAVGREASAQDIINVLSVLDEVKEDILGDLQEEGWAVQRILKGVEGRLPNGTNKLGDGTGLFYEKITTNLRCRLVNGYTTDFTATSSHQTNNTEALFSISSELSSTYTLNSAGIPPSTVAGHTFLCTNTRLR